MMTSYEEPQEAEWVKPIMNKYKMSCCDCGLVHDLDFKIENKRVLFRAFRNNRATGQIRRWMKETH
jgi:hypothetical protein